MVGLVIFLIFQEKEMARSRGITTGNLLSKEGNRKEERVCAIEDDLNRDNSRYFLLLEGRVKQTNRPICSFVLY